MDKVYLSHCCKCLKQPLKFLFMIVTFLITMSISQLHKCIQAQYETYYLGIVSYVLLSFQANLLGYLHDLKSVIFNILAVQNIKIFSIPVIYYYYSFRDAYLTIIQTNHLLIFRRVLPQFVVYLQLVHPLSKIMAVCGGGGGRSTLLI